MPIPVLETDRALLDDFRRGDKAALTRVYELYVDDVAKLIRWGFAADGGAHVRGEIDPACAQELLQEVFVRAFGEAARVRYDGVRPYRPYLLRIAKNLLTDGVRARRRAPTEQVADLDEVVPLAGQELPDPEGELEWSQQREATCEYLASVSEMVQEFVRLRFEQELGQAEVAAQLGITRRRVRTLEQRVQRGLRRHLIKCGLWRG
jgi:RNA polymerase sigma factor (sigma-70 family)